MGRIKLLFWALGLWITGKIKWGILPTEEGINLIEEALDVCELIAYREEKKGEVVPVKEKKEAVVALKEELKKYGLHTPCITVAFRELIMEIEKELSVT